MPTSRMTKSCDECHNRKVRCVVPSTLSGAVVVCTNCIKRNKPCVFTNGKPRSSRKSINLSGPGPLTDLFIDRLIRDPSEGAPLYDEFSVLRADDRRVPSSGLAFFSEQKIDSLVERLGSADIRNLVYQIDSTIKMRLLASSRNDTFSVDLTRPQTIEPLTSAEVRIYMNSYFESVHPVFPFLDRAGFEEKVHDPHLINALNSDFAFCALFNAVMGLGCQYHGCGSFQPGAGQAWRLFHISLNSVARIIPCRDSLSKLQALIAAAIFAMNASSLQLDNFLLAEATRTVLALRYHKSSLTIDNAAACYRAFWVVYHMEKQYNFQARNSSAIADIDVGCPIPPTPESTVNGYDWFAASIRISRIFSITYDSLFSVTASTQPAASLLPAVKHVKKLLEDWRQSIPPAYRPQNTLQRSVLTDLGTKEIAIRTHFYYFHLVIALERMELHLSSGGRTLNESMRNLLSAARTVVELTRFIDVEPYTPVFLLAIMPLSALFILFDAVVHNPAHRETQQNLTLLDIVSGHFSLLEHVSRGALPGNYLSRFGNMARQYVEKLSTESGDSIRGDTLPVIHDIENPHALPRVGNAPRNNAGVRRANLSSSPGIHSGFDHNTLTGVAEYCASSAGSASSSRTDVWPGALQIENEAGFGALFGSTITWEDLIDSSGAQ